MRAAALLMLALVPGSTARAADTQPTPPAPRAWLGVAVLPAKEVPVLPDGLPKYPAALEVVLVYPGSPGESAGIIVSDVVLALDGVPFDPKDGDIAAQFRSRLMAHAPGDRVELLLMHSAVATSAMRDGMPLPSPEDVTSDLSAALAALPAGGRLSIEASRDTQLRRVPAILVRHPDDRPPLRDVPDNRAIHPQLAGRVTPLLQVQQRVVGNEKWEADTTDLRARLARIAATDDGFLLDDVRFVLREPHLEPEVATQLLDALAPRGAGAALGARLRAAAARDRIDLTGVSFPALPRGVSAREHAESLAALLAETAALREAAFAPLSKEDRSFLAENAAGLIALVDTIYLHEDGNLARRKRNLRLLEIAARVPRRPLYMAALSWARLSDAAWIAALRSDLAREPDAAKDTILRRDTPQGEIVIGGSGPNRYRGFEPAIMIDLAGDDIYSNNAGTARWDALPCAAVIDLGGDDAYEATESFTQGSAFGGVGLLVDTSGNDRHVGGDFSQASAILGIAAVIDLSGDDLWQARRLSQSCAEWGLSLLFDASGDDVYESPGHGQGLGLPAGFAILHDAAGDDRYFAKGGPATGYGTQGVFDAWAQGCGLGLRQLQSGGIGILADDGGRDDMEAGNFSQGGGYYRGWGLLRASGPEPDTYIGSRYNQGFAAHAALGTFLEAGGDDRYATRDGVIAGLAWDECVTYFDDAAGDDTYVAGGFSLAASAHNAFSYFVDRAGSDRYQGTAVALAGGNDYHGGTSLSLFLDLGPGRDHYVGTFAPGKVETNGAHGFALDKPGSLESLARRGLPRSPAPAPPPP